MSTTLPITDRNGSTAASEPPSFDVGLTWPDDESRPADTLSDDPTTAVPADRTIGQPLDRSGVVRRRYLSTWASDRRPTFSLRQEWIGRVAEVLDDTFMATLVTRAAPEHVDHAEIEIEEVAPVDRERLRPGAVFYWVMGYRDEAYGQRVGVSSIIFRNMVAPTSTQLDHADDEAARALAFLEAADPSPARPSL
jgi:hypothetical protein